MLPRVLIIDDEQEWREAFEGVFASTGWDADAVADIGSAKELLKTNTYELIVLDIFLNPTQAPLNFESFVTFVVQAYPNVIVAAATGKPLAPDEAFALSRLGVSDFIYKPRAHLDDIRRLAHRISGPDQLGRTSFGQTGKLGLPVHRTIVAVDVAGFGNRLRTNRNQVAIRGGLYRAMRAAFDQAGIPWSDRDHEDRGEGEQRPHLLSETFQDYLRESLERVEFLALDVNHADDNTARIEHDRDRYFTLNR